MLITHANASAVHASVRNKPDHVLKAVAARGGTVGATIHGLMCWNGDPGHRPDLDDYVRQIEYLCDLVGPDHVAIGTDFPAVEDHSSVRDVLAATVARYQGFAGAYAKAFGNALTGRYPLDCNSPAEFAKLTEALARRGWSEASLARLYGRNLMRALGEIWR